MDATIAQHHAHMARLQRMGEHWHEKLWNGSGPWTGDRFLNLYHHPLKDEIEVRYEVPNKEPQMVFQIALADFDIDKLCKALYTADNMTTTASAKSEAVLAHNDALHAAEAATKQERDDEVIEKMQWAINQDQGNNVRGIVVP